MNIHEAAREMNASQAREKDLLAARRVLREAEKEAVRAHKAAVLVLRDAQEALRGARTAAAAAQKRVEEERAVGRPAQRAFNEAFPAWKAAGMPTEAPAEPLGYLGRLEQHCREAQQAAGKVSG